MKGEMDGGVFISRQVDLFPFIDKMIKIIFPICTLIWRVNNYVSRQGRVQTGETKILLKLKNS